MSSDTNAFGIDFYSGNKKTLLTCIREGVKQPYSFVVTPNVDHLVQLEHDEQLRDAYFKARWRVCDSRILLSLLSRLGIHLDEAIPGSDLTLDLLKWADRDRLRIVLIGSATSEADKLRALYPGISLYHYNPPMGFIKKPEEVQRCLQFVRENPSELVLYAVGTPRGEVLAAATQPYERTGMGFSIGASISFATGTIKRAPKWMREFKLEWLHRMCMEPRRLAKRYWADAVYIVPAFMREKNSRQKGSPAKQES
ncbi:MULTISPECIES: WecB/TagA/CpsF family glycosyltransferase [Stutzerimonas]|uniref:Exopolysaccharide biosynthesis WecB/TagA/CpsF family protein n=1 Tax=Stutzerimonas stutzeri TaxID=316 RepID=A0A5S5BF48_STUST|nr:MULTISPECIES: WecB/TagA/CpsF family glycosyltransferase [Stutzerimonas]MDX2354663.1 WecB/TagA/CpsF family glycosyltransferase [Stutzerimonas xanthomarina]TYP65594.1 exopolysaccharide biosynthesis WecB/TagA/CpsF family protein [Stutzerimonas stutzeri]